MVLGLIHVVCPLLFFTNLTRNPYYTQIALLNIMIAFCGLLWALETWRSGEWKLPRTPLEWPLLGFLVVALFSIIFSWKDHELVRVGIVNEGIRIWIFTVVNSIFAFYLPLLFTKPIGSEPSRFSIWSDIILAVIWGLLWFGFHSMKDPSPRALIWDTYGGFLWGLAIVYVLIRVKTGEAIAFFHVIFAVTIIAGLYGILQYMGRDIIWTSPIQPYGGRPVSTFGNPNFLSSYLMLVSPLALVLGLKSSGLQAKGYFLVSAVAVVSLLGTLTRSTYVGLMTSFMVLGVFLYRREHLSYVKWIGIGLGSVVLLILIFPTTPVSAIQSPLARFTEIYDAVQSGEPYQPWHQRILIWSSAWDMVRERPFLGKGWGAFELFYPFYQGKYLFSDLFSQFRTHANNAHNILLEVWSQVGFLGTGMAAWLFCSIFAGGWIILKKRSEGMGHMVVAALLAGLVGMGVDNFFGNVSIFFAVPAFLFWWCIGAMYNESRTLNYIKRPVSPGVGRPLLGFFMVMCIAAGFYYVKRWNQERYYFKGFKESKTNQVVQSYKSLEKAFAWFDGEVNSNYELGNSYSRYAQSLAQKNLNAEADRFRQKSIDAFSAALAANPGYDEIYFNLGITYNQREEYEKAIRNLEISLYINPILHNAYGSLGNLYIKLKRLDDALRIFDQSVAAFPKDKDYWNNLGYTYTQLGKHDKSFESYKKALMIDPTFYQAWSNLNAAAVTLGRTNEPILEAPNLILRVNDLVKSQRYREAKKDAERLVEVLPHYPDAHLSLGNILFYLGDTAGGVREFEEAVRVNPKFFQAHINLGKIYQSQGKLDLAREQYQKALKINSTNAEAKQALASLPV